MKFSYTARTQQGELQTGFIESASRESASAILNSHELFILSLDLAEAPKWYDQFLNLLNLSAIR